MELRQSNVIFNPVEHTYTLNGKQLGGVTALLERQLGSRYFGISDEVLQAADYGSEVHAKIELYDSMGFDIEDEHYTAYRELIKSANLTRHCNEYLISDNKNVASSIDVVFEDCSLADIKTTSKIDYEYVTWQLSIYAYLFELQNPEQKVNKLFVIWLPKPKYGTPKIVEVNRHPNEEVEAMLKADAEGENYLATRTDNAVIIAPDIIQQIINLEMQAKMIAEQQSKMRETLLKLMSENNIKQFKSDNLTLTRKMPGYTQRLDTAKLKAEFPEIYEQCLKEIETKETIMIRT